MSGSNGRRRDGQQPSRGSAATGQPRAGAGAAGGGCCGSVQRAGVLAVFQQEGDHVVDRHALGALGDQQAPDGAFVDGLDLHGRLVGLDLGDHVAGGDLVALP